ERATTMPGGVRDYSWSPDGRRVVLVSAQRDTSAMFDAARPIVIEQFRFKEDGVGYRSSDRSHLWLLDIATRHTTPLTSGPSSSEALPAWSPDGRSIAFSSARASDVDRTDDWNLFVVEARPGAVARQLTTFVGPDQEPSWS